MNKAGLISLLILLVAVISPVAAGGNRERGETQQAPAAAAPAQELAARVNDEVVTLAEFREVVDSNIQRYQAQSGEPFPEEQRSILERRVLDGLVMRAVLESETVRLGVAVSDEQFQGMLQQFKSQFPGEEAYQGALQQQGFTVEQFEGELRRQMAIEQLIETQVFQNVSVDEAQLRGFYDENPQFFEQPEQVAARHIILTTQGITDEAERNAIRDRIQELRNRIAGGEDFAAVAREHSQDGSAAQGGDLGMFGRGQMVPEFEEAAFSLEIGQLSEVVETQFGYHILQVTERRPPRTVAYAEVRDDIADFLLEDVRNEAAQEYVENLRAQARVEELVQVD